MRTLLRTHAALALLALASPAAAQSTPINWAVNSEHGGGVFFSAPALFSFGVLPLGDGIGSIRKCFGIDQTQGGTNQDGTYTTSHFRLIQSAGPAGIDFGQVSIQSASVPSLSGDACFSPALAQPGLTASLAAVAMIGPVGGSAGTPPPNFFSVVFSWVNPLEGPTVLGTDANGLPLLANVIFEIQGPLNGGASTQYYLATSGESVGVNAQGPGGVANGNASLASALFGVPATLSNAVSHTRLSSLQGGTLSFTTMPFGAPGELELRGDISFATPQLWAQHDGDAGAGGPDWRVSGPVSTIDLRVLDVVGAAQSTPGNPAFDPCLAFNGALFLWSATPATAMLQQPMSWDSSGWPALPPQPGSKLIGPVATERAGAQTVPVNFDAVTAAFLATPALTLGTGFSPVTPLGPHFQGAFTPITEGVSRLASGPLQLLAAPAPSLRGRQLGLAAVGVQVDGCTGALAFTEFATSLHVSLQ